MSVSRRFDPEDEYPFDMSDFTSEAELARSEGFLIDDDGHWIPIDDDDCPGIGMTGDVGFDDEDDDIDYDPGDYISEAELARGEGFIVDDDGHWIPDDD